MRKKMISIVLVFAMCMPLCIPAFATGRSAGPKSTSMTIEAFETRYVGDTPLAASVASTVDTNDVSMPSIDYSSIVYDPSNRKISFDATITEAGRLTNFEAEGTLYSSYKADHGINSVVGDLRDTTEQYEILRFEIYNDSDLSYLYAINTPETESTPTLIMYLRKGEKLYLFETPIPNEMATIIVPNNPACKTTEGSIDGFWFQNIVTPQMDIAEGANSDISIQSTENTKSALLNATWTISGVPYIYYAKVIMYYHFSDVEDNSGDWRLEFSVNDAYCRINGERKDLTGLRIKNIDMRMVTGPYTKMLNVVPGFQLYDSYSITGNVTTVKGLLSVCSAISGNVATSLATTAIDWLIDANQESNSLTEAATFYLPNSRDSAEGRTFGYNVPSRYFMQQIGDYVGFDLRTRSSDFGLSNAYGGTKTGLCEVEFDYYVGETTKHYSGFTGVTGTYKCTLA